MKNMKRISLMILALMMIVSMTACTTNDVKLLRAIEKQQEINSLKAKTDMKFEFAAEGFDELTQFILDDLAKEISKLDINVNQTIIQNAEKTNAKGRLDISGKFGDKSGEGSIWIDTNLNQENPNLVEIFKLPKEISAGILGEENSDKYIVYDISKLMKEEFDSSEVEMDPNFIKALTDWSVESQTKLLKIVEEIKESYDLNNNIVNYKGKKALAGQKLDIYEIKLNDKELKDILRYTVNKTLENETFSEVFKEYFEIISKYVVLEDELNELENINLEDIKSEFNKYMDQMEKIQVLGSDGLTMELGVSKSGYIVSENLELDLLIDLAQYKDLFGESKTNNIDNLDFGSPIEEVNGKINLKIKTKTRLSNINDKNLKVDLPKVNENNSLDFMEFIKEKEEMFNIENIEDFDDIDIEQ